MNSVNENGKHAGRFLYRTHEVDEADFVRAGVNVPERDLDFLWIVEDNSPSDIWVADKDRNGDGLADNVQLFASLRDGSWECDEEDDANPTQCVEWDDNGAEGTGIYFGKDAKPLFVNIQQAEAELRDGTWVITNRKIK